MFATKFSSIFLAKWDKRLVFDYHLLTCSVRKMVLMCMMQNIDICLFCKSHLITRLVSHLINDFSKWMFIVLHEILLNLVPKVKFYTFFISSRDFLRLNYNGFRHNFNNLNCIMPLKQFYTISTKVSSRKKCYYFWWSTWLLMLVTIESVYFARPW